MQNEVFVFLLTKNNTTSFPGFLGKRFNNLQRPALLTSLVLTNQKRGKIWNDKFPCEQSVTYFSVPAGENFGPRDSKSAYLQTKNTIYFEIFGEFFQLFRKYLGYLDNFFSVRIPGKIFRRFYIQTCQLSRFCRQSSRFFVISHGLTGLPF